MTKKIRFGAVILALMVVFVMLSSVSYIAAESHHDCVGDDCAICYHINVCENALKAAGYTVSFSVGAVALCCFAAAVVSIFNKVSDNTTLVSLKVKLTN